ncbi:[NiFe]-hydrogenase assembly chaperone HybE [Dechloromonas sp. TW-R-39-2]|uniref:[NiFe]-hydrogenase assembly chaperone HybE n=1 Tax=Dechloromonas sp. TW-R-39-2 TaxID=2654218 RepID=UPI00193D4405|nr:[NiFe]-hydrogenase assembly chaperone HybE [Dechloromonas sp. TW-R-39-2]QRM18042.1 [NiFe]-hydrogenase assembly chaperone HybE [Dechloromonas sp. TW-R-39-2]
MKVRATDPSSELVEVFSEIARTRMAGLPICNARLEVEALGFRQTASGHWAGAMVTPWAINLLCLPGQAEGWPQLAACSKYDWQFPSGNYEFTVAQEDRLGNYHLCSLFSPALEFESHEAARLTALAAAQALFSGPIAVPTEGAAPAPTRRAFLGLRG